ncbi:adenosylcobinamide-GDP ribazoletransferase [Corynebacterium gerontici]|uniref:Uncharacterized protein n=1 Tax=Corynebacterium gerontici TaxID=2079234 RepID=A0A3G6J2F1_9CORY|nr:hypothetical protein [Corynebacterium gerontici]AZA12235.1 hypothetical protein CGERO_09740 [Corynebacterium gerontici]
MSDKQLTVAELLARSGGSEDSSSTPRRRRRRSLEEGGISVAELTGNIPKVASKPAESKHSNVPIDEEHENRQDPDSPDPLEVERDTEADKDPAEDQPAPLGVEPNEDATDAQEDVIAHPLGAQPREDADEDHDEPLAVDIPDEAADAEDEQDRPTAHDAGDVSTGSQDGSGIQLQVVDEKDPVRLTTGSFPAQAPAVSESETQQPEAESERFEAEEHDAEQTTVIRGVSEPVRPQMDAEDTNVIPQIAEEDPTSEADVQDTQKQRDELEELDDDALATAYDEEEAKNEKVSMGAVILMALVGIVIGAVVFFGFQMLWGSLNKWIVTVLALLVTGAMVGVVHALRTSSDKLSMGLSALVGLVMTFGPALIA